MIQGTTPTHKFNLPFSADMVEAASISYEQKGKIVLTKKISDCAISGNSITAKLTQEETLMFDENINARIQLHIRTKGNDALVSKPICVPVHILLDKKVI